MPPNEFYDGRPCADHIHCTSCTSPADVPGLRKSPGQKPLLSINWPTKNSISVSDSIILEPGVNLKILKNKKCRESQVEFYVKEMQNPGDKSVRSANREPIGVYRLCDCSELEIDVNSHSICGCRITFDESHLTTSSGVKSAYFQIRELDKSKAIELPIKGRKYDGRLPQSANSTWKCSCKQVKRPKLSKRLCLTCSSNTKISKENSNDCDRQATSKNSRNLNPVESVNSVEQKYCLKCVGFKVGHSKKLSLSRCAKSSLKSVKIELPKVQYSLNRNNATREDKSPSIHMKAKKTQKSGQALELNDLTKKSLSSLANTLNINEREIQKFASRNKSSFWSVLRNLELNMRSCLDCRRERNEALITFWINLCNDLIKSNSKSTECSTRTDSKSKGTKCSTRSNSASKHAECSMRCKCNICESDPADHLTKSNSKSKSVDYSTRSNSISKDVECSTSSKPAESNSKSKPAEHIKKSSSSKSAEYSTRSNSKSKNSEYSTRSNSKSKPAKCLMTCNCTCTRNTCALKPADDSTTSKPKSMDCFMRSNSKSNHLEFCTRCKCNIRESKSADHLEKSNTKSKLEEYSTRSNSESKPADYLDRSNSISKLTDNPIKSNCESKTADYPTKSSGESKLEKNSTMSNFKSNLVENSSKTNCESKLAENTTKSNGELKPAENSTGTNCESKLTENAKKSNCESKLAENTKKFNGESKPAENSTKIHCESKLAENTIKFNGELKPTENSTKSKCKSKPSECSNAEKSNTRPMLEKYSARCTCNILASKSTNNASKSNIKTKSAENTRSIYKSNHVQCFTKSNCKICKSKPVDYLAKSDNCTHITSCKFCNTPYTDETNDTCDNDNIEHLSDKISVPYKSILKKACSFDKDMNAVSSACQCTEYSELPKVKCVRCEQQGRSKNSSSRLNTASCKRCSAQLSKSNKVVHTSIGRASSERSYKKNKKESPKRSFENVSKSNYLTDIIKDVTYKSSKSNSETRCIKEKTCSKRTFRKKKCLQSGKVINQGSCDNKCIIASFNTKKHADCKSICECGQLKKQCNQLSNIGHCESTVIERNSKTNTLKCPRKSCESRRVDLNSSFKQQKRSKKTSLKCTCVCNGKSRNIGDGVDAHVRQDNVRKKLEKQIILSRPSCVSKKARDVRGSLMCSCGCRAKTRNIGDGIEKLMSPQKIVVSSPSCLLSKPRTRQPKLTLIRSSNKVLKLQSECSCCQSNSTSYISVNSDTKCNTHEIHVCTSTKPNNLKIKNEIQQMKNKMRAQCLKNSNSSIFTNVKIITHGTNNSGTNHVSDSELDKQDMTADRCHEFEQQTTEKGFIIKYGQFPLNGHCDLEKNYCSPNKRNIQNQVRPEFNRKITRQDTRKLVSNKKNLTGRKGEHENRSKPLESILKQCLSELEKKLSRKHDKYYAEDLLGLEQNSSRKHGKCDASKDDYEIIIETLPKYEIDSYKMVPKMPCRENGCLHSRKNHDCHLSFKDKTSKTRERKGKEIRCETITKNEFKSQFKKLNCSDKKYDLKVEEKDNRIKCIMKNYEQWLQDGRKNTFEGDNLRNKNKSARDYIDSCESGKEVSMCDEFQNVRQKILSRKCGDAIDKKKYFPHKECCPYEEPKYKTKEIQQYKKDTIDENSFNDNNSPCEELEKNIVEIKQFDKKELCDKKRDGHEEVHLVKKDEHDNIYCEKSIFPKVEEMIQDRRKSNCEREINKNTKHELIRKELEDIIKRVDVKRTCDMLEKGKNKRGSGKSRSSKDKRLQCCVPLFDVNLNYTADEFCRSGANDTNRTDNVKLKSCDLWKMATIAKERAEAGQTRIGNNDNNPGLPKSDLTPQPPVFTSQFSHTEIYYSRHQQKQSYLPANRKQPISHTTQNFSQNVKRKEVEENTVDTRDGASSVRSNQTHKSATIVRIDEAFNQVYTELERFFLNKQSLLETVAHLSSLEHLGDLVKSAQEQTAADLRTYPQYLRDKSIYEMNQFEEKFEQFVELNQLVTCYQTFNQQLTKETSSLGSLSAHDCRLWSRKTVRCNNISMIKEFPDIIEVSSTPTLRNSSFLHAFWKRSFIKPKK